MSLGNRRDSEFAAAVNDFGCGQADATDIGFDLDL
jgi:hypothetical protein